MRHSSFRYEGDLDIGSVDWTFFNPKLGVRYALRPSWSVYASLGRTTREPTRSDLFTGEDNPTLVYDLHAVEPERVVDYEAGVEYSGRRLHVQANVYAMELRNEIALTGELSEIGLALRRNVDRSHRRGVEIEVRYDPARTLRLTATANASTNRIATWNQSFDVYEVDGSYSGTELRAYHDVRPLLTPQFIGNLGADYTPSLGPHRRPGRPLRIDEPARQHRRPGARHAVLLRSGRQRVLEPRPLGEEGRAAAARPGEQRHSAGGITGRAATAISTSPVTKREPRPPRALPTTTPRPHAACS